MYLPVKYISFNLAKQTIITAAYLYISRPVPTPIFLPALVHQTIRPTAKQLPLPRETARYIPLVSYPDQPARHTTTSLTSLKPPPTLPSATT